MCLSLAKVGTNAGPPSARWVADDRGLAGIPGGLFAAPQRECRLAARGCHASGRARTAPVRRCRAQRRRNCRTVTNAKPTSAGNSPQWRRGAWFARQAKSQKSERFSAHPESPMPSAAPVTGAELNRSETEKCGTGRLPAVRVRIGFCQAGRTAGSPAAGARQKCAATGASSTVGRCTRRIGCVFRRIAAGVQQRDGFYRS